MAPDSSIAIMKGTQTRLYMVDSLNSSINYASDSDSGLFVDENPSLVLHFRRFESNGE
jgi:hypothetical protein